MFLPGESQGWGAGGPGGLPPMGSRRVGHNRSDLAAAAAAAPLVLSSVLVTDKTTSANLKAFFSYREVEEAKQGRYPQRGASA